MTETPLVWVSVADRRVFRELSRTALAKQAGRLYAPQVWLLTTYGVRIVLPERAADTLTAWIWAELGASPLRVAAVRGTDGTPEGTADRWGLPPRVGAKVDLLATQDVLRVLAHETTRNIDAAPIDAWGRFAEPGEEMLRGYYRARVNYQVQGVAAGRLLLHFNAQPSA